MLRKRFATFVLLLLIAPFGNALADEYAETIKIFKDAGQSGAYFESAYGYAVFPTIAKGGFVVGGAVRAAINLQSTSSEHPTADRFGQDLVGIAHGSAREPFSRAGPRLLTPDSGPLGNSPAERFMPG